jgi:hypothetical protein
VVGAQVDLETGDLGPIITPEVARGLRPDLDDPTRLTNGALHPRYAEWISFRTWTDQHPLNEYLTHEDRVGPLVDDRGYFDRKRVARALGPSGSRYWLVDGPLPTKAKIPVLAQLLKVPAEEVETEAVDTDQARWRAMHGECRAGRNGYTDAPVHCMRCCGVPAPSPEQLATIMRILHEAAARREREEQGAALQSPEVQRQRHEEAALKRAKRITKLEVELARLRAEQAQDRASGEDSDAVGRREV